MSNSSVPIPKTTTSYNHHYHAYLVFGIVSPLIFRTTLECCKIQQGIATHQAFQLCCAKQVQCRSSTQHHKTTAKCLCLNVHKIMCMYVYDKNNAFCHTQNDTLCVICCFTAPRTSPPHYHAQQPLTAPQTGFQWTCATKISHTGRQTLVCCPLSLQYPPHQA